MREQARIGGRELCNGFNHTGEIDAQNRRERMSCVGRSANTNLEIEWGLRHSFVKRIGQYSKSIRGSPR